MEVHLTTENFNDEVNQTPMPVLVDFWAPWCGPCQMISPVVEQLAKDYSGKLKVCKLNVDEAPEIATRFAVMSIPALIIFKEGKIMEKRIGAMGRKDMEKFVQPYV